MKGLDAGIALVTGATGLLGTVIAERLASEGSTVFAASRSLQKSQAWVEQRASSKRYRALQMDLADPESIRAAVNSMSGLAEVPNIVIANASLREGLGTSFDQLAPESFSRLFEVDVAGHFLLMREVVSRLPAGQTASFVLMSSIYGVVGVDHGIYPDGMTHTPVTYAAAKGAAMSMSRWLAGLWGSRGIRVNAVVAGGVLSAQRQNDEFVQNYSRKTMLGRMAVAEEIASAVTFVASEEASYITGQCLVVDGGFTAW